MNLENTNKQTLKIKAQDLLRTADGKKVEIDEQGSLSLLAAGYIGLMAWREKRVEIKMKQDEQV